MDFRSNKFKELLKSRNIKDPKLESYGKDRKPITQYLDRTKIINNKNEYVKNATIINKYFPKPEQVKLTTMSEMCDVPNIDSKTLGIDTKTAKPLEIKRALYKANLQRNEEIISINKRIDECEVKAARDLHIIDFEIETKIAQNAISKKSNKDDYIDNKYIINKSTVRNQENRKKYPNRHTVINESMGKLEESLTPNLINKAYNEITQNTETKNKINTEMNI